MWRMFLGMVFSLACISCGPADSSEGGGPRSASAGTGSACPVRGVWELESVTVDGEPEPLGARRQIKLVTDTHFAFVSQEGGALPLVTVADTLQAYRTRGFGGGTYSVGDSTYSERLDFFANPEYVGRDVTFSCRVLDGRWHHGFDWTFMSGGREGETVHVQEVWRRLE